MLVTVRCSYVHRLLQSVMAGRSFQSSYNVLETDLSSTVVSHSNCDFNVLKKNKIVLGCL
jgi:hypothetical protein